MLGPETKFPHGTSAPQAGNYTLAVEPGGTTGAPLGNGTGHATVKKNGAVKIAAKLENGGGVPVGCAITAGGRVPIYAAIKGGSFSAPLRFADKPDSDLDGTAFWASSRDRSRKYAFDAFDAFDAFTAEPRIFAQRYTAPERGDRAVLGTTNGAATLSLAGFAQRSAEGRSPRTLPKTRPHQPPPRLPPKARNDAILSSQKIVIVALKMGCFSPKIRVTICDKTNPNKHSCLRRKTILL